MIASRAHAALLLLLLALVAGCTRAPAPAPSMSTSPSPRDTESPAPSPQVALANPAQAALPAVEARRAELVAARAAAPYVLLREDLDAEALRVQALAVTSSAVQDAILATSTGEPQRAEVFGVEPASEGGLPPALVARCAQHRCYRVVLYLYGTNTTLTVVVEAERGAVLSVASLAGVQADVPPLLAELAIAIAIASPATAEALGMEPSEMMARMAATKSALNGTRCERSRHLCVAPTFPWGDGDQGALWVVVDLTDFRVVGVQWTDTGASSQRALPPPTEASLQNAALDALCERAQPFTWGDWAGDYLLTPSDGLEVRNARYQGRPVLLSAKLVDWHVSYSTRDGFGYADGTGCPSFSSSAVLPLMLPQFREVGATGQLPGALIIEQEFRSDQWPQPCNYAYANRYTFYADGRFRIEAENRGRGCGTDGVYRPVMRIQLAGERQRVAAWDGDGWKPWMVERWAEQLPRSPASPEGAVLRVEAGEVGIWEVDLAWRDGLAEQVYLYATLAYDTEGAGDLATIGGCCATGFDQGPDMFIGPPGQPAGEPERLGAGPVTLWYVPQLVNAERQRCWADARLDAGVLAPEVWPCSAGALFVPRAATERE